MASVREVVDLSRACVAACDREDYVAASTLMRQRDAMYVQLDAFEARLFGDWAFGRITDEQLNALTAPRAGAS